MKEKQWSKPHASLVPADQDHPPIVMQPSTSDTLRVKVLCSSLRVRKTPDKNSDVLFFVKKDDILDVIQNEDTPDDWINMIFKEKTGWVMKEFTEEV